MMPLNNPTHAIQEAKRLIASDRRSEIRLNANGGNSILIVCDPLRELEYITLIEELLTKENYEIIDLNKSLINFISNFKDEVLDLFDLLQTATHEIFKAPIGEESNDLFKEIISQVQRALNKNKVPVMINVGALYGTGIESIHIMECGIVMNAALPLIILYPAKKEGDKLMFLGKRPASKYRCMVID